MTPTSFMTAFMKSLIDLDADTDKFNKTIDALTPFNSAQAIIDSIHSDIASAKSANDFLLTQCGIDLSNADVGGLLGYDASGNDVINSEDVMDETGLPLQQTVPRTATIEGFTITFPDMNKLTPGGQFINKALYSWWYPLAFKIIKDGYGLGIVDTSYVKQMDTDLFQEPAQNGAIVLAYVMTHFNTTTGVPSKLSCRINTHNDAYGNIDTTNPNGYSANLGTSYLDRTLLHELTHALMSTNIRGFNSWLPDYFVEGSAELINGCDDTRREGILDSINNVSTLDDGFSETPSSDLHWYTTGFIFLRYLIKHSTSYVPKDTYKPPTFELLEETNTNGFMKDTYKPPTFELLEETNTNGFMFERGITRENNFEKIFTEYSEFLQKKSDTVQAWELCDNSTLHSYYGNTFRIPLKNAEEKVDSDIAGMIIERKSIKFKIVDKVSKKSPCYYLTLAFHITPDEYRGGKRPDALFANKSAEFASFNLHQLYDKNLVSYEQGGGVAKRSFDMEIRNKRTHLGLLNHTKKIPHPTYIEISHEGCYTYPMDNTGCPLISYASEDHEDYDSIEFYFTKTNYGSNITLCFYSSKKESVQPIWQSISFGTFDTHEESYIMPLYIGGGTTGLRSSSYTYSYTIPPSYTITKEVHGKLYDFSITQYSGSMSNLLYPTKLDETNITNFFVLAPDGEWKSLYNSVQETRIFGGIDISANIIKDTDSHGIVYSTASDDTRDTFDYNTRNVYSLYPISMYSENEENRYMGSIPYNFGVTSRASTGLTYINGDRYLIIPNGWEHRIAYPFTVDSNSSDSIDEQLRKYMLNISKLYFKNHLAVKVGAKVGTASV